MRDPRASKQSAQAIAFPIGRAKLNNVFVHLWAVEPKKYLLGRTPIRIDGFSVIKTEQI